MGVLYMVGYGTPVARLTLTELEARLDWRMLHPELRRRLLALFEASGGTIGIGGGFRTTEYQMAVFIQRHRRVDHPTGLFWDGSYWELVAPYAPAAPPGFSYHEPTLDGFALAADLIFVDGSYRFLAEHGHEFGLIDFADVNGEPWHVQPAEIPHSRRNFSPDQLDIWLPPGGEDMSLVDIHYVACTDGRQGIWRVGSPIQTFENEAGAVAILGAVGISLDTYLPVAPGQFDRLLNKVQ